MVGRAHGPIIIDDIKSNATHWQIYQELHRQCDHKVTVLILGSDRPVPEPTQGKSYMMEVLRLRLMHEAALAQWQRFNALHAPGELAVPRCVRRRMARYGTKNRMYARRVR